MPLVQNMYQASLTSDYFISDVEEMWTALEQRAEPNFFLSWNWIGTWLTAFNIKPMLLEIKNEKEQTVGLGFLTKTRSRYKFLTLERFNLNRTGNPEMDQIWIEYNDILLESENENEIRYFFYRYLGTYLGIDEIFVGISELGAFCHVDKRFFSEKVYSESKSYQVLLNKEIGSISRFLATLSRNTRYQIQRSIKIFESQYGELTINKANNREEKEQYLSEIAKLHKNRWDKTETPSGFNNSKFILFHRALLANKEAELLKVDAGLKTLGYLYCFRHGRKSLFYLSGIEEFSDKKLKPGLVLHSLAITHYARLGLTEYDFLAGDYQYKQSLSNQSKEMSLRVIRKKNFKTEVVSTLESIKHFVDRRCIEA